MSSAVQVTYVSQKINKIRWIPEEYAETKHFLTGSWDDEANSIKVWTLESANDYERNDNPRSLSKYPMAGDVTEIKLVDKNRVAISSSNGDVRLLEVSDYDRETPLRELFVWNKLHNYGEEKCSCSVLDTLEGDVATAGEDGSINILNCRQGNIALTIKNADSCSIYSLAYMRHNEIITGNIRGHMKVWDLRTSVDRPSASFLLSDEELAATCVINHPMQPHIILAGSESGSLTVWDLRMKTYPASSLKGHTASVTEMQFHPENPHKLLTSSSSGDLWCWNMEIINQSIKNPSAQAIMTWTPLEDKTNKMVTNLIPPVHHSINSFHCNRSRILCGTDDEAVYLVSNVC